MPTLSTPTLTLGDTVSNKRDVTVAGTITFDAGDVGKTYRLEIKLFGDDSASDNRPAADSAADDLIYTYQWTPPFLFLPRPFKAITVTAAGNGATPRSAPLPVPRSTKTAVSCRTWWAGCSSRCRAPTRSMPR